MEDTASPQFNFELLRATNITDFRDDPDTKLHLQVNVKRTQEL